jgi:hypothetical protein
MRISHTLLQQWYSCSLGCGTALLHRQNLSQGLKVIVTIVNIVTRFPHCVGCCPSAASWWLFPGLEIATIMVPQAFLVMGSCANMIKGLSWMAGGSTRSVFNLSFVRDNNIAGQSQ